MKIVLEEVERTIGLAFCFRNSEKEIPRALKPWLPHVDYVIAVDGLFKLPYSPKMIDNALQNEALRTIYSTDNSKQILKDICGDKLWYDIIYGTQIQKRQLAFDIAGKLGVDVLIVMDSDEYIHPDYMDFESFYRKIGLVTEYNGTDEDIFWMNAWIPDNKKWSRQFNNVPENIWRRYTRIHYKPSNQKYILNHFTFTHKDTTEEDLVKHYLLRGDGSSQIDNPWAIENPFINYPHLSVDGVRFTTDRDLRTDTANEYGNGWTWQWLEEEKYRTYLVEMKVLNHQDKVTDYKPGTYYFNEHRVLTPYDEELQSKFNSLNL